MVTWQEFKCGTIDSSELEKLTQNVCAPKLTDHKPKERGLPRSRTRLSGVAFKYEVNGYLPKESQSVWGVKNLVAVQQDGSKTFLFETFYVLLRSQCCRSISLGLGRFCVPP